MKKAIAVVLGMVIFQFLAAPLFAREINVGLELFPPLISEDGKGLSIDLLRAVENISDLEFKIVIVPYNRAKKELETGKRELIGHTPTGLETKDFYKYAQELTWFIPSVLDIYAMTETNLDQQRFAKLKRIGTPHGNEHFFSALY
ncbi:MAG: hypothetical protein GY729_19605, partial [Desulfobacteraceae bacterium]|nr:hypothetical protein [Desulfobacteraceae bacterium]